MTIDGHIINGQIVLNTKVALPEGMKVRVELLPSQGAADLNHQGISAEQAADLRRRLKPFADDWDRPDMDVYDAV